MSARPRSSALESTDRGDTKRRRKIRTCDLCRRRKLQCDQALPACNRCARSGQAANCRYPDDSNEQHSRDHEPAATTSSVTHEYPTRSQVSRTISDGECQLDISARLELQERRSRELETALTRFIDELRSSHLRLNDTSAAALPGDYSRGNPLIQPPDHVPVLLKGKHFKTRFYGATRPESLVAHTPALGELSSEIVEEFPILTKVKNDFRSIKRRAAIHVPTHLPVTKTDLDALLPPKPEADALIRSYFETYDKIYHVIHEPTFWKEYVELWKDPNHARPHFEALVLAMIATTRCLRMGEPQFYSAKGSDDRVKAISAIQLCDRWLSTQGEKRITVTDYQIRFLLTVAKVANSTKLKQIWTDAGTNLKHAMAAGLHQDPALLSKGTSVLDMEMRRRIWFATAEFELQTSFLRGMPSDPWPEYGDHPFPGNICDDDLNPHLETLPTPKSSRDFTSMSYLTMATTTFMLRYRVNAMLNKTWQAMRFDQTRKLTEDIETGLQSLPEWSERESRAARSLLVLDLCQYLLALHHQHLHQASTRQERDFSRLVIVDTALKVVTTHEALLKQGCTFVQLFCNDHLRVALAVCHVVSTPEPLSDRALSKFTTHCAQDAAVRVVEIIESKVERLGAGHQHLWIALVASAFIKSARDPEQKASFKQEAMYKMTNSYYKMLACLGPGSEALCDGRDVSEMQGAVNFPPDRSNLGLDASDAEFADFNFDDLILSSHVH